MTQVLDELISRLATLPESERKSVEEDAYKATAGMKWVPSPGPQTDAYFSKADILLYGGEGGGGKGHALDAPILTPFGFRPMESLKIGSLVSNPDGTSSHVIGIYPLGRRQLYTIAFHDGTSAEVTDDHIWLAWKAGHGQDGARLWTTAEMMRRMPRWKFLVPLTSAVCFTDSAKYPRRPVHPYLLGVLLGDGSLTVKALRFTTADKEIADRVEELGQRLLGPYQYGGRAAEYRLPEPNAVRKHLKKWGLIGRGSVDKFIPPAYLLGSTEERFELLRGLMDTDGWADKDGDAYYCTISRRLRDDVASLARSLGALVTVREKHAKAQNGNGSLAYTLRIKLPDPAKAFTLPRKKVRCEGRAPQSMTKKVVSITPSRMEEAQCIRVSHPNSLYLTSDYTVTHNSDLGLGLGFTAHKRSLILRRKYTNLDALIDRAVQINGSRDGFNGKPPPRLTTAEGRLIVFGANQHLGDEQGFQGQPFDLKVFDEATQFLEQQVRFHIGWIRNADDPTQRTRALLPTNPPIDADGEWIIGFFRPWLDITHPRPAKPGDLRYFITAPDGKDLEVDGPRPVEIGGKKLIPHSRSFIPAKLSDNPYLVRTDYQAKLDALPEPIRSAVRDGNFMAARQDADFQVIPTAWIIAAQARWSPRPPHGTAMTAQALDPAGGGRDTAELACRYGGWYAELVSAQGEETADGSSTAATVTKHRRDNCPVIVDVGGGYGGAVTLRLKDNGIVAVGFNGASSSSAKTRDGQLSFANKRAEAWWKFREELNPDQEGGSAIALPPDPELRADLAAPTWTLTQRGILIESKDELRKRLGRSPGKGDAVVMALSEGNRAVVRARSTAGGHRPQVVMGHQNQRRKRH